MTADDELDRKAGRVLMIVGISLGLVTVAWIITSNDRFTAMNSGEKSLTVSGIAWLACIALSFRGKPFELSNIAIGVMWGFLAACVTAIVAKLCFELGFAGLCVVAFIVWQAPAIMLTLLTTGRRH